MSSGCNMQTLKSVLVTMTDLSFVDEMGVILSEFGDLFYILHTNLHLEEIF